MLTECKLAVRRQSLGSSVLAARDTAACTPHPPATACSKPVLPQAGCPWQLRERAQLCLQTERKKCIDTSCDGIITFIEAPSRYSILNIEDEVKVRQVAGILGQHARPDACEGQQRKHVPTGACWQRWPGIGPQNGLPFRRQTGAADRAGMGSLLSPVSTTPCMPICTALALQAEMGGSEAVEEEVPEWQRYKREQELDRKERRYRFKKGRGRRDEEEEVGAARHSWQGPGEPACKVEQGRGWLAGSLFWS